MVPVDGAGALPAHAGSRKAPTMREDLRSFNGWQSTLYQKVAGTHHDGQGPLAVVQRTDLDNGR
jgi:hypothetical protein